MFYEKRNVVVCKTSMIQNCLLKTEFECECKNTKFAYKETPQGNFSFSVDQID